MTERSLDPNNADDQKIIEALDQTFHTWLVQNNLLSRDGIIYRSDKLDNEGNPVEKVDPDTFDKLLNAEQGGFVEVAQSINPTLRIKLKRHKDS